MVTSFPQAVRGVTEPYPEKKEILQSNKKSLIINCKIINIIIQ